MQLFIDANIFLSFYDFTSDDLKELDKLALLIQNKKVTLQLPQQVIDEIWRNREPKLYGNFPKFRNEKFSLSFPSYCKNHKKYDAIRECQKKLKELHSEMVNDLQEDIENKKLDADRLLQKLFSVATILDRTQQLIDSARERVELGNPPGKKGSIGDALNWETLLSETPDRKPLCLISGDTDFASPLSNDHLRDFLQEEWKEKKASKLQFYRTLTAFFKEHFENINLETENINLETEMKKDELIQNLTESGSFASTHASIERLSDYDTFTQKQAEDLLDALLINSQVNLIIGDHDVKEFFQKLYDEYYLPLVGTAKNEELENLGIATLPF